LKIRHSHHYAGWMSGQPGGRADSKLGPTSMRWGQNDEAAEAVHDMTGILSRQRLALILLGLTLAAVLSGVAGAGRPHPPATLPARPAAAELPTNLFLPATDPQIDFVDADHGFALVGACTGNLCPVELAVTVDGGRSWSVRRGPRDVVGHRLDGDVPGILRVLDQSHVLVLEPFTSIVEYSADAGATWRVLPPAHGNLDEVPVDGAALTITSPIYILSPGNPSGVDPNAARTVVYWADGSSGYLRHEPPLGEAGIDGFATVSTDGRIWTASVDAFGLHGFVSADRGRTWTPLTVLAAGAARSGDLTFATVTGTVSYVEDMRAHRLWRSVDSGQHWQSLSLPFAPTGPLAVRPQSDGSVIVGDPAHLRFYQLFPLSQQFVAVAPDQRPERYPAGARLVNPVRAPSTSDGAGRPQYYEQSRSGFTWTRLPFAVLSLPGA
jgi:hypothetical protein